MNTLKISLPSKGLVYAVDGDKSYVEIREPTGRDETLLTNINLLNSGDLFIRLIQNMIVDPKWKNIDFLSGDSEAILFAIRFLMYGNYKSKIECPLCKNIFDYEYDLSNLELKTLDVEPVTPNSNLFEKAIDNYIFRFSLPTNNFDKELNQFIVKNKSKFHVSFVMERFIRSIKSINDITDLNKIRSIVENDIKVHTLKEMRNYINEINPGVKKDHTITCPSCIKNIDITMALGADFFWQD